MKRHLILAWLMVVIGVFCVSVFQKERQLRQGVQVLLELAPVDPRSLMQGDYMALRYGLATTLSEHLEKSEIHRNMDGVMILTVDQEGVGTFVRFDDARTPLKTDEVRVRYKGRKGTIRLGAESFFFQEGSAATFEQARYGELRVASDGTSILVGLRDENRRILGAEQRQH